MRWVPLLLLMAVPAAAFDREEVEALVRQLGAESFRERNHAGWRLAGMGDEILPLLSEIRSPDPEVRRYLRALLKKTKKLRLHVVSPPERHAIGEALTVEVHLLNETEDSYTVPTARRPESGVGTWSVFTVTIDGQEKPLRPDQVEILSQVDRWIMLDPGRVFKVRLKLEGEETGLRRPGPTELRVSFVTDNLVKRYGQMEEIHQETMPGVRIDTEPFRVLAVGRTPAVLEAALRSKDERERQSAIAELGLRSDAAALPLLRRHAADPGLRFFAVSRLGEAALVEDLDLIRSATGDPDRNVRLAAIRALGGFRDWRARTKLITLARDHALRLEVVRALRRHKHRSTVRCFIALLKYQYRDAAWVKEIQDALYEWTGKVVKSNESEIRSFEEWWAKSGRFTDDR